MPTLFRTELSNVSTEDFINNKLSLQSTIQELPLYDFHVESSCLGQEVARIFDANLLLPGIILIDNGQLVGMISRQQFFEKMSRPYGLDLFLKRPINCLYKFASTNVLKLPGNTLVVAAARKSLQRPMELLYEPIVVDIGNGNHQLLDVHSLLLAQSQIHELTSQMLDEKTQSKILETEKMASLGRTIAEVSHEIRNPVNCISGNLQFILTYCKDLLEIVNAYEAEHGDTARFQELKADIDLEFLKEDLPKVISSMTIGAERLTKIIGGLRNFSHMDATIPQQINIHECIDSTLLILNNALKNNIEVRKRYGDLPSISCYSGQLSQVFMNIISNAIDALTEKASEQASISNIWKPQIEITTEVITLNNSRWVSVQIADNGPGIPPEIQSRIFETFFTTKRVGKGTGLGLAISNQIITEKHQGKLLVRSQPRIGTQMEILLPLG